MDPTQLATEVGNYPWYHTLDLGGGVVTKGMFDHRGTEQLHMIPDDLSGLRCLDVATMDGFWAFTMERRGAAEVVALDIADPDKLDWPASLQPKIDKKMEETKAARFAMTTEVLRSKVQRVERSVYDLHDDLGQYDLVFCGDLLLHLKDPVTALERIRSVCRGSAIVCNPVKRFRFYERRPMAEFDGIDEFQWWVTNLTGLERMVRAAGFARVEVGKTFDLPATGGGPWRGTRGVVRGYV